MPPIQPALRHRPRRRKCGAGCRLLSARKAGTILIASPPAFLPFSQSGGIFVQPCNHAGFSSSIFNALVVATARRNPAATVAQPVARRHAVAPATQPLSSLIFLMKLAVVARLRRFPTHCGGRRLKRLDLHAALISLHRRQQRLSLDLLVGEPVFAGPTSVLFKIDDEALLVRQPADAAAPSTSPAPAAYRPQRRRAVVAGYVHRGELHRVDGLQHVRRDGDASALGEQYADNSRPAHSPDRDQRPARPSRCACDLQQWLGACDLESVAVMILPEDTSLAQRCRPRRLYHEGERARERPVDASCDTSQEQSVDSPASARMDAVVRFRFSLSGLCQLLQHSRVWFSLSSSQAWHAVSFSGQRRPGVVTRKTGPDAVMEIDDLRGRADRLTNFCTDHRQEHAARLRIIQFAHQACLACFRSCTPRAPLPSTGLCGQKSRLHDRGSARSDIVVKLTTSSGGKNSSTCRLISDYVPPLRRNPLDGAVHRLVEEAGDIDEVKIATGKAAWRLRCSPAITLSQDCSHRSRMPSVSRMGASRLLDRSGRAAVASAAAARTPAATLRACASCPTLRAGDPTRGPWRAGSDHIRRHPSPLTAGGFPHRKASPPPLRRRATNGTTLVFFCFGERSFSSASNCSSRARRSISSWLRRRSSPALLVPFYAAAQLVNVVAEEVQIEQPGHIEVRPYQTASTSAWSAMLQKASSRARALRSRSSRSWRGVVIALPSLQKRTAVQCFGRGLTKSDRMAHKVLVHSIQIHPTELQQPAPPKRGLLSFGSREASVSEVDLRGAVSLDAIHSSIHSAGLTACFRKFDISARRQKVGQLGDLG